MSIRAKVNVDYSEVDSFIRHLQKLDDFNDSYAKQAARKIHQLAKTYAPARSGQMVRNSRIRRIQQGSYTITFARTAPGPGYTFDVALWLHSPEEFPRGEYKNVTTPGTGPRYLERAYDELAPSLHVKFALELEHFLRKAKLR